MGRCEICGKPTTSHKVEDYFVCHSCWVKKDEELENLKKRAEEEKEQKKSLRSVGKVISKELDKVDSKEELYTIFEEYQDRLNESLDKDPEGKIFKKIECDVSEKLCNLMFDHAREKGWDFVLELIDRYGLENKYVVDQVPVENVTGRMIILSRAEEGVEKIPVKAFDYLANFSDAPDFEWEESFTLGWGFDHPDFDFEDILEKELEEDNGIWASGILERAFYADQENAAPILIEILEREDLTPQDKMYLVQAITFFTDEERWNRRSVFPRYWDWREELDYYSFVWDEDVEMSLKEVIEEELADYIESNQSGDINMFERTRLNLPANRCDFSGEWSFIDLQI
ncbi:MAG: hypothetical protein R6W73_01710 [Candidatus Saliniplasma sp.]